MGAVLEERVGDRAGAPELALEDPLLHPARTRAFTLAGAVLRSDFLLTAWRARGLRLLGADLGAGTIIEGGVRVTYPPRLRTGASAFVNSDCLLDSLGTIAIGDDVSIGPRTCLLTTTHESGRRRQRAGERTYRPVVIGPGSWLGANVTVLPGVTIGPGVLVGAGSVVVADLEPDGLYAGSPARLLRRLG